MFERKCRTSCESLPSDFKLLLSFISITSNSFFFYYHSRLFLIDGRIGLIVSINGRTHCHWWHSSRSAFTNERLQITACVTQVSTSWLHWTNRMIEPHSELVVVVCCACRQLRLVQRLLFCVNFFSWFVLYVVAGELSRHVPVGVMNSRNARINFSPCQSLKNQVSSSQIFDM